jgi:hypothetical protein
MKNLKAKIIKKYTKIARERVPVEIVSYPKSGRTWVRYFLGLIYQKNYAQPFSLAFHSPFFALRGIPRIGFNHGSTALDSALFEEQIRGNIVKNKPKQVILLIRDPRDIAISAYYHRLTREGSISEQDDFFGVVKRETERAVWFMNAWAKEKNRFQAFTVIRYEQLQYDPSNEFGRLLESIGVETDAATLEAAIAESSFSQMREVERSRQLPGDKLKPKDATDPRSYKTREGIVGSHKKYLTDNQITQLNTIVRQLVDDVAY